MTLNPSLTNGRATKEKKEDILSRIAPTADFASLKDCDLIVEAAPEGNVLIVCHGLVINAYLSPLLGLEQHMFFLPDNTSLNTVVVDGHARSLRFLNDVRHLTEPDLFVR